ncbi:MAG: hypothetical protein JST58_08910 [Bacteroidetes bacterium]|jgi:hypothetical protein|nr:hypothetical protein [Bacteroidota bacterium]
MKKVFIPVFWGATILIAILSNACKKSSATNAKSEKYQIVTGTWKQTDIVLGVPVSVKVGNTRYDFPAGTSMITNPYLKAFGVTAYFQPTTSNSYQFSDSGTYQFQGTTDLILPVAGNAGKWTLEVYDAVLKLTAPSAEADPHWINAITTDSLSLSMTVKIPGLGAAPLNLLLQKQQ